MDAAQSLAALSGLSSDIAHVAIVDADGSVVAATAGADGAKLALVASELFEVAAPNNAARGNAVRGNAAVAYVEVGLPTGSVFAVREGMQTVIATTGPEPASALVLHDLRTLFRSTGADAPDA